MIAQSIANVRERLRLAANKAGKSLKDITLVAVTKGVSLDLLKEAIECGIADIGENRVQEAVAKYNALKSASIRWHMIGHLQTNKAKDAVRIFDLIQSVDSFRLALELDKQAKKIGKIQDILIEVKTSQEAAKFGISLEEAHELIKEASSLNNINIRGLMTIAPLGEGADEARPYFRMLRELRDRLNGLGPRLNRLEFLSMGMSCDFEVAVEEGANMVRLGRIIFG